MTAVQQEGPVGTRGSSSLLPQFGQPVYAEDKMTMRRFQPNSIQSYRKQRIPLLLQRDLAARVGCSTSEVSKYERGQRVPSLPIAMRIAAALGHPVEDVFWAVTEEALDGLGDEEAHG